MVIFKQTKIKEATNATELTDIVLETLAKNMKNTMIDFNFNSGKGSYPVQVKKGVNNVNKIILELNAPILPIKCITLGREEIAVFDEQRTKKEVILYTLCQIEGKAVKFKNQLTGQYISIKYK